MQHFIADAKAQFDYTQRLRRDFHRHPELGFQEFRTAAIVAGELGKLNLDRIETEVAKTGVVGLLQGAKPGPVLLLRFDMDALPILEENETDYVSQTEGLMHACGHDAHTAIGLTVAKLLAEKRDQLAGTIKFVFQPAEEGLGGAAEMVKDGVLEDPKPDYSLAVHVWNDLEIGKFGITPGPMMGAAETFRVVITGKGGHGAAPHQAVDPIFAASQVINALQSIVSRNVPPLESAVVTVGSIQGGSAFNIIPPKVELLGTIRTFTKDVRNMVLKNFEAITTGVAGSLGCSAEIEMESITPAVNNDPELTLRVQKIVQELFPEAGIETELMTMGSEDFAFLMDDIPGCFVFVGSANEEKGLDAKHHHPKFDIDERAMRNAVALVTAAAVDLLSA